MKRILAAVLCALLLLGAVPVSAEPETEPGRICQAITDDYVRILECTNRASLQGYCGLMASWQLFFLGVNDWVMSHHGKDQFDAYCQMAVTSGGHTVKTYSFQDYTLAEALDAITKGGTQDVYNLLVGFEKTSSVLGSVYGHSIVLYAIVDGVVYFTESYDTSLGRAGAPYQVPMEDFVDYYDDWTVFEGIAVFGKKGYAANCKAYAANLFGEVTAAADMTSQPCPAGTADAQSAHLRAVTKGERLWVNALLENPQGQWYYQVDDSGVAGYIPAEAVVPIRFNYEDVEISNLQLPEQMAVGGKYTLTGRIASVYSTVSTVELVITDEAGAVVRSHALAKHSGVYDLESDTFRTLANLRELEAGVYQIRIRATGENHYIQEGKLRTDSQVVELAWGGLRVGEGPNVAAIPPEMPEISRDGWFWEEGTWYYYENGAPRVGWYCYHGGDYYLKEDGSVTTGWVMIKGKWRLFSRTGSMRTGWVDTEKGRMYLMSNGAPATGWRTVDGERYFFDEQGLLQ